jgi:hypothetical protein
LERVFEWRSWNGSWGRLARRDVLLYEDAGQWVVEARSGGAEGRSAWREYDDEQSARDRVLALVSVGEGWREVG